MPYDLTTNSWNLSPELEKLQQEKRSAIELQERKHEHWTDNLDLYRNKVKTNRLTQRQAVNIPLMKETVKTLLSKIDDSPNVDWKELGGDKQKEIYFQEIWNTQFRDNNLELLDILDKKNVLLYGYSTKKLNINKKGINVSVLDPYDVLFDPLMNVWDTESSRYVIHQNIFRTVRDILATDKYLKEGKDQLKVWLNSPPGLIQGGKNREEWEKKMERLRDMGITSQDFQYFAGGDTLVNLTEHFSNFWNTKTKKFEKRVVVYADDKIKLLDEKLSDLIGVDFWPFVRWSEDPELNDIYPDSVADLICVPNKVLNVWFSQLVENRTLKNFQMHWFLPGQNYTPQTYTPGPGAMLPAPPGEDINKVIKPVEISGLDDTLTAIQMLIKLVERGSGATALEKGATESGQQTLGEVQILVGKSMERTTAMAKFYRLAWYELATKWEQMMNRNAPRIISLHKAGRDGKLYEKRLYSSDWVSKQGYRPQVTSTSEQEAEAIKGIQKFTFVAQQFPNNQSLRKVMQRRMLELVDLTPDELRQIEEEEETTMKNNQMMQEQQMAQQQMPQMPQPSPEETQLTNQVKMQMQQLGAGQ